MVLSVVNRGRIGLSIEPMERSAANINDNKSDFLHVTPEKRQQPPPFLQQNAHGSDKFLREGKKGRAGGQGDQGVTRFRGKTGFRANSA